MRIAFINGSPKVKDSVSGELLKILKSLLTDKNAEVDTYELYKPQINENVKEELYRYDALVFAFPLYVDGIPSNLLYCLKSLQEFFCSKGPQNIKVYGVINCGFFEGSQNEVAIEILRNWSTKSGLSWGQGIGVGGGGMLISIKNIPLGHGPKKNLGNALHKLVKNILDYKSDNDIFVTPNFPRFLYILGGNKGWRDQIKANGLKVKDLFRQL
ncbi:multimeric flavodoxin WrbA [Mobilisporobacter senegalensis]|uniref:Multimeric flavodoxin WrbA n=1 Tax=Mobilisporobacter senegalensis TaxID=1329262 RepID=A0A3N1XRG0_9FIRM|nr:NAD(P)H-dependent oxidoreductase [Mobilisporobacter senegalensis]ROR29254.1 multimeric flavodoxin WrbA [Mobilisporobacter senegalensis]